MNELKRFGVQMPPKSYFQYFPKCISTQESGPKQNPIKKRSTSKLYYVKIMSIVVAQSPCSSKLSRSPHRRSRRMPRGIKSELHWKSLRFHMNTSNSPRSKCKGNETPRVWLCDLTIHFGFRQDTMWTHVFSLEKPKIRAALGKSSTVLPWIPCYPACRVLVSSGWSFGPWNGRPRQLGINVSDVRCVHPAGNFPPFQV